MKIKSHLDFGKETQVINITLHKVDSLPSPGWAGGFVYLIPTGKVYYHNGSEWIAVDDTAGMISEVTAGGGITVSGTGDSRKVTFAPDNSSLDLEEGDEGKAKIKDKGIKTKHIDDGQIDADQLATGAVTTIKIANKNITFAKIQDVPSMTVIGRVDAGEGVTDGIEILSSLDAVISAHNNLATAKAIKDYVDGVVGGIGSLQGDWSTTPGNFPSGSKKGDYWFISDDGLIDGISFVAADVIVSKKDNASPDDSSDWICLKTKRGQASTDNLGIVRLATTAQARAMSDTERVLTPSNLGDVKASNEDAQGSNHDRFVTPQGLHNRTATTTRRGIAEIATQAEVDLGTDSERIVTPQTLRQALMDGFSTLGKYTQNLGNGSATSITVDHNLGTKDVNIDIFDNATGEAVIVSHSRTTIDKVVVNFASAPASNAYRIVIQKQ